MHNPDSNNVRQLRQRRRFTIRQLAALANVSAGTIQYIEGGGGASRQVMLRVAHALGVRVDTAWFPTRTARKEEPQ